MKNFSRAEEEKKKFDDRHCLKFRQDYYRSRDHRENNGIFLSIAKMLIALLVKNAYGVSRSHAEFEKRLTVYLNHLCG